MNRTLNHTLQIAAATSIALLLAGVSVGAHARGGPSGHAERSFGPNAGGQAQGTRTLAGPAAYSEFSGTGPNGNGVSGSASSVVTANGAAGQAQVQTTGGRSATAQGSVKKSGDSASGQGSIQTGKGYGVSGSGQVSKTATGISGSATATTNSGRTASGTVDGNKDAGTVSVTNAYGTRTKSYDNPRY